MGAEGLEPSTFGLKGRCSTIELRLQWNRDCDHRLFRGFNTPSAPPVTGPHRSTTKLITLGIPITDGLIDAWLPQDLRAPPSL